MFTVGICDDNPGFLDLLKSLIESEFERVVSPKLDVEFLAFYSGESVLKYADSKQLDLLFLDIDMPITNGFEVANVLSGKNSNTLIVFMSAYDNFMYESFNYCPFSYLKKSTILKDLRKLIRRVNEKVLTPKKYITIVVDRKEIEVDVQEILCIESNKNYYNVHLINGDKYVCRGTLTNVETMLSLYDFFKVHSAYIVNLEYTGIITEEQFLCLNGLKVPIAQKRMSDYRKAKAEYSRRKVGV